MNDDFSGPSWDLLPIYSRVSDPAIENDFSELQGLLDEVSDLNSKLIKDSTVVAQEIFMKIQSASELFSNLSTYANCLLSVNSADENAQQLFGRLQRYRKEIGSLSKPLHQFEAFAGEEVLENYLKDEFVGQARFSILYRRQLAPQLLSGTEEQLIEELAQNGLHAWGNLYDRLSGSIECDVLIGNQSQSMGLSQAATHMMSSNDAERKNAWQAINHSWRIHEEACAAGLNAITGWRLDLCNQRSQNKSVGFLDSAVHMNKISLETLNALLSSAKQSNSLARRAAKLQARAMGKGCMGPWDSRAPAPVLGKHSIELMTFDEGIELIKEAFSGVDESMGDFVQMMADNRWIEGSISAKKRPGAYCTSFAKSKTPRVYMTYSGSTSDVITLAHELGHAFHFWIMRDLPETQRQYGMSLAETASTMGETAVRNALLARASSDLEKLDIMWEELSAFTTFMLNIPSRFEFEKNLYNKRQDRPLSSEELRELMSDAWAQWYGDSISEPDPMFWASKLHFYISGLSFYNFPYLFGYLFSLGVYSERSKLGDRFYSRYCELLRDTGRMTAEDLAERHLGFDIQNQSFWDGVVHSIRPRIDEYERLLDSVLQANR